MAASIQYSNNLWIFTKQSLCSVTLCFMSCFVVLLDSEVLPLACLPTKLFFLKNKNKPKKKPFIIREGRVKSVWCFNFIFIEHKTEADHRQQSCPLSDTVQRKDIRVHLDGICFTCCASSLYCWLFRHEAKTLPKSTFTHWWNINFITLFSSMNIQAASQPEGTLASL